MLQYSNNSGCYSVRSIPSYRSNLSYHMLLCASLLLGFVPLAFADTPKPAMPSSGTLYGSSTPYSAAFLDSEPLGSMQTSTLSELSGLAASNANPGLFWAHNDSGDSARVFLIDPLNGDIKLEVNLKGIEVYDCEDITMRTLPDGHYLVLGDIGDNRGVRDNLALHQFREPKLGEHKRMSIKNADIQTMTISYEEGARDAETLMSAPDGQLIIITKRETLNYYYQFRFEASKTARLTSIARIPIEDITAGDMRSNGELALRTYAQIYYWPTTKGNVANTLSNLTAERVLTAPEPQGEALAWGTDGSLLSIPEKPFMFSQVITKYPRAAPEK